jgi:uncharacterized YccA/Bax inhibitor family protein
MNDLKSTNPALSDDTLASVLGTAARGEAASATGVMTKTAMFLSIAGAVGGVGYAVVQANPQWMMIINITALVVTLGAFYGIRVKPALAAPLGFVYAGVEGFLLGGIACMLDIFLERMNKGLPGGIALTAALMTAGVTVSMLLLYTSRIVRPTQKLAMILSSATLGIFFVYLAAFLVSLIMPSWSQYFQLVTLQSAMTGGTMAWLGLGINVLILFVAAFWLVIDFGQIEEAIAGGAPKQMEWYLAFGLLVTLAWVYFECLKLAFRIAMILGNRK